MFDIESIQAMYLNRAVETTKHFHDRVKERCIKYADVKNAIAGEEIIEQNLDDLPNPGVLYSDIAGITGRSILLWE